MSDQHNWYKYFFDGMALELWDRVVTPDSTQSEIDFIHKIIPLQGSKKILDIPCGSGRHSTVLAGEGHEITAVDLAPEYTLRLARVARERKLPVEVVEINMLDFVSRQKHDVALCLGNSFNYFDRSDTRRFLSVLGDSLVNGGYLLINTGTLAETVFPNQDRQNWMEIDGLYFLMSNRYDVMSGSLITDMQFIRGDHIEKKTAYHFLYRLSEVRNMLEEAGFDLISAYRDFELSPYGLGDQQAYLLAVKK